MPIRLLTDMARTTGPFRKDRAGDCWMHKPRSRIRSSSILQESLQPSALIKKRVYLGKTIVPVSIL
ncbi:MAG: hypothetical protein Q8S57_11710 [Methanoregula sp.]|nr:hypothetical protein [Methanoregula sp.]